MSSIKLSIARIAPALTAAAAITLTAGIGVQSAEAATLTASRLGAPTPAKRSFLPNVAVKATAVAPAPVTTTATPGGIGAFLHNDPNRNNLKDIAKASVVVLHANQWGQVAQIKKANPKAKVYFYSNASAYSTAATGSFQPNVVTYNDVKAHPAWILKNASTGAKFTWPDFTYLQPLDLANPSYISTAATRMANEIKLHGWDGIMLDDVNYNDAGHGVFTSAKFTTGTNREAATTAFLKGFTPALKAKLKAAGKTGDVIANTQQDWNHYQSQIKAWAPYVDVFNFEHGTVWGDENLHATSTTSNWGDYQDEAMAAYRLAESDLVNSLGKRQWTHDYVSPTDTRAARYNRGMFLMGWNGTAASASMITPANSSADSFYVAAGNIQLGLPKGKRTMPITNVYKRAFAKGTLYVNASKKTVTIDGITMAQNTVAVK